MQKYYKYKYVYTGDVADSPIFDDKFFSSIKNRGPFFSTKNVEVRKIVFVLQTIENQGLFANQPFLAMQLNNKTLSFIRI